MIWTAVVAVDRDGDRDRDRDRDRDEGSGRDSSDGDTPQAPYPRVDRSRPNHSDVYRSSTQNADATILHTCKVDDIPLSILTIATPGDRGLSHL
jgi:hypothetical protein